MGQRGVSNDSIQAHLTAGGGRDSELRTGKRLAGHAVPLLDNQSPMGFVFEGEGHSAALFDLHRLGLGIDEIAGRGLGFRHHHAPARLETGDQDLAVPVCLKNAVAVPNEGAVRVGDFELGVSQGHAGIDGAHLADQQIAVREVFKVDGDDALLPIVRKVDGLGALEDAVPVRRVNFLHDV